VRLRAGGGGAGGRRLQASYGGRLSLGWRRRHHRRRINARMAELRASPLQPT
jgi:hypothetical protein